MERIRKPREVVDRKALVLRLEEMAGWEGYAPALRPQVLALFKEALEKGRAEVRRRFEEERATGPVVAREHAYLVDQLVRVLYDFTVRYVYPAANPTTGEQLSVAAVGGYGRGELAPQSDIDLLFLLPYRQTAHVEQVVEYMLYMLWDLGLKVGHATRSVDECVKQGQKDFTIRTALLDARWLWGDEALFKEFQRRYAADVMTGSGPAFVEAKLSERDARHERMGDARYVLEPNIKEGKGGLRDLQTLFWIAKYLYRVDDPAELVMLGVLTPEDASRFAKARTFLWTVRCHLHYVTGRPEERLTFDVQNVISGRMGYTDRAGARGVERFMKHYFLIAKDVGDLTRILCAVLEEQHKKRKPLFRLAGLSLKRRAIPGFRLDGERLAVESPDDFARQPIKILRLFHEAQRNGIDIHPAALRAVSQNLRLVDAALRADPEANRLFVEMLASPNDPEITLTRLNDCGVLGRFIPDFGRVVAQMQYDMYHVYTVDEHTIRAIGILSRIERGELAADHPVATEIVREVQSRRALYVAVLLHDVAKGRGGDHSVIGAEIARRLGPRLGLSEEETESVSWLVLNHLLMSHTAFKRDVGDAKTVADFVAVVQSPERLRLLSVLTIVDIRAVGPTVWNNWKAGLLRELYYGALEAMTGGAPAERRAARVERAKQALRERLAGWEPATVETFVALGYPDYWLSADDETHARHAVLVRDAEAAGTRLHVETRVDRVRAATEVIVYTADHPGLFSRIAGAIALAGGSIVEASIATLSNGMALDTFLVHDALGGIVESEKDQARLRERIAQALEGRIRLDQELAKVRHRTLPGRAGVFKVPPRVLIDNMASATHTVIEVNGRDRPGFLYDVTAALTAMHLQISSAIISTYGERVVDVFYIKDIFGLKVEHDEKLKQLRERLLKAIEPEAEPAAARTAAA